jgi:hypothetical protein
MFRQYASFAYGQQGVGGLGDEYSYPYSPKKKGALASYYESRGETPSLASQPSLVSEPRQSSLKTASFLENQRNPPQSFITARVIPKVSRSFTGDEPEAQLPNYATLVGAGLKRKRGGRVIGGYSIGGMSIGGCEQCGCSHEEMMEHGGCCCGPMHMGYGRMSAAFPDKRNFPDPGYSSLQAPTVPGAPLLQETGLMNALQGQGVLVGGRRRRGGLLAERANQMISGFGKGAKGPKGLRYCYEFGENKKGKPVCKKYEALKECIKYGKRKGKKVCKKYAPIYGPRRPVMRPGKKQEVKEAKEEVKEAKQEVKELKEAVKQAAPEEKREVKEALHEAIAHLEEKKEELKEIMAEKPSAMEVPDIMELAPLPMAPSNLGEGMRRRRLRRGGITESHPVSPYIWKDPGMAAMPALQMGMGRYKRCKKGQEKMGPSGKKRCMKFQKSNPWVYFLKHIYLPGHPHVNYSMVLKDKSVLAEARKEYAHFKG